MVWPFFLHFAMLDEDFFQNKAAERESRNQPITAPVHWHIPCETRHKDQDGGSAPSRIFKTRPERRLPRNTDSGNASPGGMPSSRPV
jgi:hypothetical protein